MIKIINETPDKSVIKQIICNRCGCTLEYLPLDVKTANYTFMGEDNGGSDYIECLKCKSRIIIREWT